MQGLHMDTRSSSPILYSHQKWFWKPGHWSDGDVLGKTPNRISKRRATISPSICRQRWCHLECLHWSNPYSRAPRDPSSLGRWDIWVSTSNQWSTASNRRYYETQAANYFHGLEEASCNIRAVSSSICKSKHFSQIIEYFPFAKDADRMSSKSTLMDHFKAEIDGKKRFCRICLMQKPCR